MRRSHARGCTIPREGERFAPSSCWHGTCTRRPQEVMTMLPSAIVIPTGLLGSVLEPAALFAVWGVVVVGVLAGLSAAPGRAARADEPSVGAPPLGTRNHHAAAA